MPLWLSASWLFGLHNSATPGPKRFYTDQIDWLIGLLISQKKTKRRDWLLCSLALSWEMDVPATSWADSRGGVNQAKQSKWMDQQLDYNGITGNQAINHACMQLPLCHITQFTTTTSTRLPVVLNSNLWGLIPGWWFWSIWIRSMTATWRRRPFGPPIKPLAELVCMMHMDTQMARCAALDGRTDAYISAWNFWRFDAASTNELKYHRDARGRRAACHACTHVSSVIITPANYKREINLYAPTISYYKSFGFSWYNW